MEAACGGKSWTPQLECPDGSVSVPAGLFKIVFDPKMNRLNAFLLPNVDHPSRSERGGQSTEDYLDRWRLSVRNLEDRVGYTFMPKLDRHSGRALTESCPASMIR